MRERLKSLHLLRQVRERGCHARLKLLCRISVGALPNLVLASGDEEGLLGTKAAPPECGANLIQQLGGRVSKIARKPLFIHETPVLAKKSVLIETVEFAKPQCVACESHVYPFGFPALLRASLFPNSGSSAS